MAEVGLGLFGGHLPGQHFQHPRQKTYGRTTSRGECTRYRAAFRLSGYRVERIVGSGELIERGFAFYGHPCFAAPLDALAGLGIDVDLIAIGHYFFSGTNPAGGGGASPPPPIIS